MTSMDQGNRIPHSAKGSELHLSAPLTIIASESYIEGLRGTSGARWIADAEFVALDPAESVSEAVLPESGIVVFEVDPEVPASMDRIRQLHRQRPRMPQIAALKNVDLKLVRTLVREGVADVVELPFSPEEILQTVVAVLETHRDAQEEAVALAPMIAITRALGGSGATTIASHMAASLAAGPGNPRVCIFDLDIQSGRMAEVFGLSPRRTLSDLLEAKDRMDAALLHTVAETHSSGVALVAAPTEIMPIESLSAEEVLRVIGLARREFDYVILDLPSSMTNWTLNILAEAQSVVMIVEQTLASLRQARRRLDLFRNLGLDHRLVSIAVNRTEKKLFGGIGMDDVEKALGHPVLVGIALDQSTVSTAQDQGVLAGSVRRKSAFVADVDQLAERIAARVEGRST